MPNDTCLGLFQGGQPTESEGASLAATSGIRRMGKRKTRIASPVASVRHVTCFVSQMAFHHACVRTSYSRRRNIGLHTHTVVLMPSYLCARAHTHTMQLISDTSSRIPRE
jgi:hypothetical protein